VCNDLSTGVYCKTNPWQNTSLAAPTTLASSEEKSSQDSITLRSLDLSVPPLPQCRKNIQKEIGVSDAHENSPFSLAQDTRHKFGAKRYMVGSRSSSTGYSDLF